MTFTAQTKHNAVTPTNTTKHTTVQTTSYLLLQTGSYMLKEDNDKILLANTTGGWDAQVKH